MNLKKTLLLLACVLLTGLCQAGTPLMWSDGAIGFQAIPSPRDATRDANCFSHWTSSGLTASTYTVAVGETFYLYWCDPDYYTASNNWFSVDHFEIYAGYSGGSYIDLGSAGLSLTAYMYLSAPGTVYVFIEAIGTWTNPSSSGPYSFDGNIITIVCGSSGPPCASGPSPSSGATGVSTSPTLSWGSVSGATSYDVYLGTTTDPSYVGSTSGTNFAPGTLSSGTLYYWGVIPKNASGSATGCALWNFTTGSSGSVPSCAINPSPPDGTAGVSTNPTLSWPAVSGATSYDVYFGAGSSPSYVTNTAGTSYVPGVLSQNTPYYWKIAPKNASGTAGGCTVWSFTTSGGSGGCSGTPIFIAASAHASGGGGSEWRTDAAIYNASSSTASVALKYLPQGGDNSSAACLTAGAIPGNASMSLDDVVLSLAGVSSGAGGLAVYGTTSLVVNSRTYNQAAAGTFGQGIPGHPASQAVGAGSQRVLIQVHENSNYRTNVGFLNTGSGSAAFTLTLFDQSGGNLGTLPYTLYPYEQKQIGQIFRLVTSANIKNGRILISVSSGAVLFYASVVDNITGDPTYIEPQSP